MKKIFKIVILLLLVLCITACKEKDLKLTTPKNVVLDESGLITWDVVPNAEEYIITINGKEIVVKTPFHLVTDLKKDFTYSVKAIAEGYETSPESEQLVHKAPAIVVPEQPKKNINVGISGSSEVKSGKSITLTANVTGTENKEVIWSIKKGQEYVSINSNGVLTAKEVDGDKVIEIAAKSKEDNTAIATKIITIVTRPTLTQEMLDMLSNQTHLGFEGYVNINLYPFGSSKLYQTYTTVVKTALDGEYWYAEYENTDSYTTLGIYYKNHNGYACQVGVNFLNEEQYEYALDDYGRQLNWQNYGLYNNFKGLKVSDFKFNDDTWRWEYCGSDQNLDDRMITSANPYEFKANGFALIIEEGEILGIYAKSKEDYTIVEQYTAIQELYVAINYGEENVDVKKVPKYTYDEEVHGPLKEAIEKIQQAENYTLQYKDIQASSMINGYIQSGFTEYITDTDCYFEPFTISYDSYGNEVYTPQKNSGYGYHKFSDDLYNAYFETVNNKGESTGYEASRAYQKSFDHARPTFAFAPEIFTQYYIDEEEGTTTYYVDALMSPVASTFYYGVGNDINLYGIYATTAFTSATDSFTPYIVVDNTTKTIKESGFYYYLGYLYGVIEIDYLDFGETSLPEDVEIQFEKRLVPTSWKELLITKSGVGSSTDEDTEINAWDLLKDFFGILSNSYQEIEFEENMPFFGDPLGDTYGFGLTSYHYDSQQVHHKCITFYYDVPLDVDYSIESSLEKIEIYLLEKGFTKNQAGEFNKGNIWVAPVDQSLDLIIYVWKN